jgi:Mg-chelatase subunit ChlD
MSSNRKRKGVTLIFSVAMMTILLPMVGLAVDTSLMYAIKARLAAAVDAAVLAGARSLNRGMDLSSQEDSARGTAAAFFSANFPDGYLRTRNRSFTTAVAQSAYRTRTVTMTATVDAPSYFMRMLGFGDTTLRVQGQASRRDVNVVLVLDRSNSLATAGVCGQMKTNAQTFVDKFSEGRDRVGLLTFGGSYRLDFQSDTNFKTASPSISTLVGQISCGGSTGTAQALWKAYNELQRINEAGSLNLIVFFTDGVPTAVTAEFPVKRQTDTRYDYSNTRNLVSTAPSTCRDSGGRSYPNASWNPGPKFGFIARSATTAELGATLGVMNAAATSITNNNEVAISDSSGCNFSSDTQRMRRDISNIPGVDKYGNATTGYKSLSGYTYTSGPYTGLIRVDMPPAIGRAAINAADSAAQRIRSDTALNVITYTIGLGGTSTEPADHDLMRRLSNDPASSNFDNAKPPGFYVYAPTTAELGDAFARVASEILRLAL